MSARDPESYPSGNMPGMGALSDADQEVIARMMRERRGLTGDGQALGDPAELTGVQQQLEYPLDTALEDERPLDEGDLPEHEVVFRGGRLTTASRPQGAATRRRAPGQPQQRRRIPGGFRTVAVAAAAATLIGIVVAETTGGGPDELAANTKVPAWIDENHAPDVLGAIEPYIRTAVGSPDASIPVTRTVDGKPKVTLINPARINPMILRGLQIVVANGGGDPYINSASDGIDPMSASAFSQLEATVNKDRATAGEPTFPTSDMATKAQAQLGVKAIADIEAQAGKSGVAEAEEQLDPQDNVDAGVLLVNLAFEQWSKGDLTKPVTSGFFAYYFKLAGQYAGLSGKELSTFVSQNMALLGDYSKPKSKEWATLTSGPHSIKPWLEQVAADQTTFGIPATKG